MSQLFSSLQLVALDSLLQTVAEEAYTQLQRLAATLPSQTDEERKRALLLHLASTRQRLQRLDVLLQWCHKARAVAECKRVLEVAAGHADALRDAADQLAYLHGELLDTQAPPYDVPTAVHVLQCGGYHQLPTIIEDELKLKAQAGATAAAAASESLARMDFLLRCKLMEGELPPGLAVLEVGDGEAVIGSTTGQYSARVTLVPAPPDEVTLIKWSPPSGAAGTDAQSGQAAEEPEVTQPGPPDVATGPGAERGQPGDGTVAMSGARRATRPSEPNCWRWRLLSFEMLPQQPEPVLQPELARWLQRNLEDRMWAAADAQRLEQLGKGDLIGVPPPPATQQQRQQRQLELDAAGRGPLKGGGAAATGGETSILAAAPSSSHRGLPSDDAVADEMAAPSHAASCIPDWARSPLAAMHSVLMNAGSRLVLSSVVVEEARQLEQAAWAGNLRVGRPPRGSGCRLFYWLQVPVLAYSELQSLRAGEPPVPPTAVQPPAQMPPAVDVLLSEDGQLQCTAAPPLQDPDSGQSVALGLRGPGGAVAAEHLLLSAAAHSSALQLAGLQAALRQDEGLAAACGEDWSAELSGVPPPAAAACGRCVTQPPQPPVLHLLVQGEVFLAVSLQLRSGQPSVLLGPALAEDGDVAGAAETLAAAAQARLDRVTQEATTQAVPPGHSRATLLATLTARVVGGLAGQLVAEQRMVALAVAAAGAGLQRAQLPRRVLAGLPPAHQAGPATTLALAVPPFPPPRGLSPASGISVGNCGSLRCYILADMTFGAVAPRLELAVCSATPRGVVTGLRALLPVPLDVTRGTVGAEGAPPPSTAGQRGKRKRESAGAEESLQPPQEQGLVLDGVDWLRLVAWARREAAQQQLEAQLEAGGRVQYKIEVAGLSASPCVPPRRVLLLTEAPSLEALEILEREVASGEPAANGEGGSHGPVGVALQLDPGADPTRGAWITRTTSAALAGLPGQYAALGLAVGALTDDRHVTCHISGVELRHELASGDSAIDSVAEVTQAAKLHAALARMLPFLQPQPGTGVGVKGGGRAKWQQQQPGGPLSYAVPGCASVGVAEVGWTSAVVLVSPPPPPSAQRKAAELESVKLCVQWAGGAGSDGNGGGQLLKCTVIAEPALPDWVTDGLAAHLESGQEQDFLDAASITALGAALLQQCALAEEAQREAGLLPGALAVERGAMVGGTSDNAGPCTLHLRQLGRAAQLTVEFHCSGGAMLRMRRLPAEGQGGGTSGDWAAAAWARVQAVPGHVKCGAVAGQGEWFSGWVPVAGLGAALHAVLGGVAQRE